MISLTAKAREHLETVKASLPAHHHPIWDIVSMGFG